MTDIPQIIIIYDPTGRVLPFKGEAEAVAAVGIRHAHISLAADLEPAAIAGIATQLGLLLLEQLAPPLKDE